MAYSDSSGAGFGCAADSSGGGGGGGGDPDAGGGGTELGGGGGGAGGGAAGKTSKYIRYTPQQIETLEAAYQRCPRPTSLQRAQLIRSHPDLSNIDPKQVKVWFQNRRCRDKARGEVTGLRDQNIKLQNNNKNLQAQNAELASRIRATEEALQTLRANATQAPMADKPQTSATTSISTLGSFSLAPIFRRSGLECGQHGENSCWLPCLQRVSASIVGGEVARMAEETMSTFLGVATGGLGSDHWRDAGQVHILDAEQVIALLEDRMAWDRSCRRCLRIGRILRTPQGGRAELRMLTLCAPSPLVRPRRLLTMRVVTPLPNGVWAAAERSVSADGNVSSRSQMHVSGVLARPQPEDNTCYVVCVDHVNLRPPPGLPLQPLSMSIANQALRHVRKKQVQQPRHQHEIARCLVAGFASAAEASPDDGWRTVAFPPDQAQEGLRCAYKAVPADPKLRRPSDPTCPVLSVSASLLMQNVSPSAFIKYLKDHREQWANCDVKPFDPEHANANNEESITDTACPQQGEPANPTCTKSSSQFVPVTTDEGEVLELLKMPECGHAVGSVGPHTGEKFLLRLWSDPGLEENQSSDDAMSSAALYLAPVDAARSADAVPLLASGFSAQPLPQPLPPLLSQRSSLVTVCFQFPLLSGDATTRHAASVAARNYVKSVCTTLRKAAAFLNAKAPVEPWLQPAFIALAKHIVESYKRHIGVDLLPTPYTSDYECAMQLYHIDSPLVLLAVGNWDGTAQPNFSYGNRAGLLFYDTTFDMFPSIAFGQIVNERGRADREQLLTLIAQFGFAELPPGIRYSAKGHTVKFDKALMWTVFDDNDEILGICGMYGQWQVQPADAS
eukprot:jgi/Chlat1/8637/Chrsp86S08029